MTGDLTTLANVRQWLNLPAPGPSDALLSRLITACSTYIQTWLNCTIAQATYIENRNGTGGRVLPLLQGPVTAMQSLTVDGIVVPPRGQLGSSQYQPYGFIFDDFSVMLSGSGACFPREFQNVTVVYTAGYQSTPPDLEQACIDMIGDWFKYKDRIGKLSEGIEQQTITFVNQPIPARTLGVLQQYRRVAPIAA